MPNRLRVVAPAKVNLCLSVGGVRADGYHEITTVMHVLALADDLTVTQAEQLSVRCRPSVGVPDERNLAYRAARAFEDSFGIDVSVAIDIEKNIPAGAGLGGGSSDAAAVIAALAVFNGFERTDPGCLAAACAVGADTAFFLHGPAAEMTGRGDELATLLPPVECDIALIHPGVPVPTGAAYAAFDAAPQPQVVCDAVTRALQEGNVEDVCRASLNNLEVASASVVPEVALVLSWLRDRPQARCGVLAGSGSAAFAIVNSPEDAHEICENARSKGWWAVPSSLSVKGLEVTEADL